MLKKIGLTRVIHNAHNYVHTSYTLVIPSTGRYNACLVQPPITSLDFDEVEGFLCMHTHTDSERIPEHPNWFNQNRHVSRLICI